MANHHSNRAVVHGIDRVVVKAWRLQNAGGKHNLVPQRVVISIRRRRRHAPAAAIDRLADGLTVVFHNKTPAGKIVFKKRIPANVNLAVVLPLIGIANFGIEGGDFGHRPLLSFVAHPRPAENVVPHGGENIAYHFLRPSFRLWWKVFFGVFLPQGLAQELVSRFHASLPARFHLGLAPQVFAEESKILFHYGSGERFGG